MGQCGTNVPNSAAVGKPGLPALHDPAVFEVSGAQVWAHVGKWENSAPKDPDVGPGHRIILCPFISTSSYTQHHGTMKPKIRQAVCAQSSAIWSGKFSFIFTAKMHLFSSFCLEYSSLATRSKWKGCELTKLTDNHPLRPFPATWSAHLLS